MALKTYISNPAISNGTSRIGLVSFDGEFLLSTLVNKKDDIDLIFTVTDKSINDIVTVKVTNKNFIDFKISDDRTYIFSEKFAITSNIYFFGEEFAIRNNMLYKKIKSSDSALEQWTDYYYDEGELYGRSNSSPFGLIIEKDGYIIKRNLLSGEILTNLFEISLYHGDALQFNEILEDESIFLADSFNCRFVINDGKLLSLLAKEKTAETYKKIRTFSFPKRLDNGGIKISFNDSMELNQLSFSFLQANV
jgi:hypothetical protein